MNKSIAFEVKKLGQSIWLDYIDRHLVRSGQLEKLVEEEGVLGLTSNPTIFQKAISQGRDYEEDIIKGARAGKRASPSRIGRAREVYEDLTITDIQEAADILYPVYRESQGRDGLVSLEPPAQLAYDLPGTMAEVEQLWQRVKRENVMIKMPATPEGVQALPLLIARGININVTLIFSDRNYFEVASAYLQGLENLSQRGGDMKKVSSVASVFVSRIDTAVDQLLEKVAASRRDNERKAEIEGLRGKAAVAHMKAIYQIYLDVFSSNSFRKLETKGAMKQRLLLGSTSTKNPAYSDVKYVEELIGKDTINTIPYETLRFFQDHGKVSPTLFSELEKSRSILSQIDALDIDLQGVYSTLQVDGVKAFADSLDSLLAFLEGRLKELS